MSAWAGALTGTKVLLVDEVWDRYSYFGWPLSAVSRRLILECLGHGLSFADIAMATSSVTQRALSDRFGDPIPFEILPDGVEDVSRVIWPDGPAKGETYDFISVGRLVPIKRQIDFLRALAQLRSKTGWRGRAAIIGFGPLEDQLRRSIVQLGLENQVDLLTRVPDDRLRELLLQSKVYVLCSEREGFSRSTLEAVAWGVPVIVSRPSQPEVFGVSDFVRDGRNGLYYDVGNVEQLAREMTSLIQSPELRVKLTAEATSVRSTYGWDRITERFSALIQKHQSRARDDGFSESDPPDR